MSHDCKAWESMTDEGCRCYGQASEARQAQNDGPPSHPSTTKPGEGTSPPPALSPGTLYEHVRRIQRIVDGLKEDNTPEELRISAEALEEAAEDLTVHAFHDRWEEIQANRNAWVEERKRSFPEKVAVCSLERARFYRPARDFYAGKPIGSWPDRSEG